MFHESMLVSLVAVLSMAVIASLVQTGMGAASPTTALSMFAGIVGSLLIAGVVCTALESPTHTAATTTSSDRAGSEHASKTQ